MNVIVIAAIALLVLIVLMAIFGGRMGLFSKSIKETGNVKCGDAIISGTARTSAECATANGVPMPGTFEDVTGSQVCCTK